MSNNIEFETRFKMLTGVGKSAVTFWAITLVAILVGWFFDGDLNLSDHASLFIRIIAVIAAIFSIGYMVLFAVICRKLNHMVDDDEDADDDSDDDEEDDDDDDDDGSLDSLLESELRKFSVIRRLTTAFCNGAIGAIIIGLVYYIAVGGSRGEDVLTSIVIISLVVALVCFIVLAVICRKVKKAIDEEFEDLSDKDSVKNKDK